MPRRALLVALVALVGCGGSSAPAPQRAAPPLTDRLDAALAKESEAAGVPGAVAAVVVGGRLVWSGAYGRAAPGRRMTPDTAMALGSITKTVVAAAALKLAEQGRLDLDDRASRWVPEWRDAGKITLRQLLSQTSGVADPDEQPRIDPVTHPARVFTPAGWLADLSPPSPGPTDTLTYANANFIIAGLAVKRAAGAGWPELLRSVAPGLALQPDQRVTGPAAVGYWYPRERRIPFPTGGGEMVPSTGMATIAGTAGALAGTAPALARFGDSLLGGELLEPDSLKEMTAFSEGRALWEGLGLGLARQTVHGRDVWGHVGDIPGFHAELWHLPDEGLTLAAAWNDDLIDDDGIVRALLPVALTSAE